MSIEKYAALILILPAVISLALVTIGPFIYSIYLSLHIYNLARPEVFEFIGGSNYVRLLMHPEFQGVLKTSGFITAMSIMFEFLLGFGLALLTFREFKLRGVVRTILVIPMMVVPIVVGLIFNYMFQYTYGVINYFIELMGLQKVFWLTDPSIAPWSIIIADTWQWTPFFFAVILAGLASIPKDLYDASQVDGASPIQMLRYVTLPLLLPVILVTLLFRIADSLRLFDLPYIMTMGGPGFSTSTISFYSFKQGLFYFDVSTACTIDTILLIIMIIVANLLIIAIRRLWGVARRE
jgi:multiple sugar transport system permease protein